MVDGREVIDEVIIETKPINEKGASFFIHGKHKAFDPYGNIILSKITKLEQLSFATYKTMEIKLPDYYKQAKEIHIQRQTVSKLIIISKKIIQR